MPHPVTVGSVVTVRGLDNNRSLNGRYGRVVGGQGERVVVEIQGVGRKAIKGENLSVVGPVRAWCHSCGSGVMGRVTWTGEVVCRVCNGSFVESTRNEEEFNRAMEFHAVRPEPSTPSNPLELFAFPLFMGPLFGLSDDVILHRLHEESLAASQPTRPPASKALVASLPRITTTAEHSAHSCPVCQEDFTPGETAMQLPCGHLFHQECITPWLEGNNSCPTCRHELPTDDQDYERAQGRNVAAIQNV